MTKKIPSWAELNSNNGPIVVAKKTTKNKEDWSTIWTVVNETQKEFNDAISEWQMAKVKMSAAWIKVVTAESKRNLTDKEFLALAKSVVKKIIWEQ